LIGGICKGGSASSCRRRGESGSLRQGCVASSCGGCDTRACGSDVIRRRGQDCGCSDGCRVGGRRDADDSSTAVSEIRRAKRLECLRSDDVRCLRDCNLRIRAAWIGGVAVGETVLNQEPVATVDGSRVGSILSSPCLGVERTILSLVLRRVACAVDVQQISVEELAGLFLRASTRAERSIKGSTGEDDRSEKRVGAELVRRSIDSSVTQSKGIGVARNRRECCTDVAIRAGNDDLEVLAPLARVDGVSRSDWTTPPSTFDEGGARRVSTSIARLDRWRAFPIHIERPLN
jgi:hypothetical protein